MWDAQGANRTYIIRALGEDAGRVRQQTVKAEAALVEKPSCHSIHYEMPPTCEL